MDTNLLLISIGVLTTCAITFLGMFLIMTTFLRKVGPNQALIVYGAGGTRVIVGGSHFVIPYYQHAKYFSLELMSFTINMVRKLKLVEKESHINVEATVLIKVRTDEPDFSHVVEELQGKNQLTREDLLRATNENSASKSVLRAAELFLDKTQSEREGLIRIVIEGHLSGIIAQQTFEELVKGPEEIAQEMFKTTAADLDRMGLEMVSFTIKEMQQTD